MQIKHKLNHSLFIFGLVILLFVACPLASAQTSPNDIVFQSSRDGSSEIYSMKADGSGQINLTNSAEGESTPDWSPDGSRIVFARSSGIWAMNADGSNKIQLTNVFADTRPSWSPNGGKIVFERVGAVGTDVYVMNADGSNQIRLTTAAASAEQNTAPEWSPDSSKIVFNSNRAATGGDLEIYVMNADGSNQTALTDNTVIDNVPDWSPDGSKIAFQTNRNGDFDIYTMNADGSNQTRITTQTGNDFQVSWSPDSAKFVFATDRHGNQEIYTMNADGSNQVRLTTNTATDTAPSWKPIQTAALPNDIVFDRRSANFNNSEIFTMRADGSNQTNLSNNAAGSDLLPDWSPDGSRIVFTRSQNGIWIMNADGSNRIQLTNGNDGVPSWSPDGSKIVFNRFNGGGYDIYVMNVDGSNPTRLTTGVGSEFNYSPRWSPDSSKIVFRSDRSATGGDNEIYVMNADGTNQTALTNNTAQDFTPDWSPDGSKIAFNSNRDGNFEIYVMNADGSNQTRITNNPAIEGNPSWSPDGTKLAFVTNRDGNDEIYTMNADGSNSVRLTNNTVPDGPPRWKRNRAAAPRAVEYDYFGTGRSDYLLFNYENRAIRWDILRNPVTNPAQIRHTFWGFTGFPSDPFDFQVFGDYDGDLKTDVGTWRVDDPAYPQQSYFYIQRSSDPNPSAVYSQQWGLGLPTDYPVNGDFDGDGKDDFTVVREQSDNQVWYILPSGGGGVRAVRWGAPTDQAIPFGYDYNGDGRDDLIVIRTDSANGNMTFYIGDALTGTSILTQQWGNANAAQGGVVFYFVGNYLGDSRADVGVYYGACPTNPTCEIGGSWWFKETGSSNYTVTKFGVPLNLNPFEGDFPSDGDYDGDGKLDITVYRPENSTFYSRLSSNGQLKAQYFDGISATPPANTKMLETALPRGKSIPANALKAVMISKQPDGTFKTERVSDFYLNR